MEDIAPVDTDSAAVDREERRRDYEAAFVLSAEESEGERNGFLSRVRALIADGGGELVEVSLPKTFPLAYPIRHERQGVFVSLVFRAASTLPAHLLDTIRHDHIVLRSMVFQRPKLRKPRARRVIAAQQRPAVSVLSEEERAAQSRRMEEQIEAALKESR